VYWVRIVTHRAKEQSGDPEPYLFRHSRASAEGGFTVLVPALPEIVTEGDTEEEALAMAQDAIRLVLEDGAARGSCLSKLS
jgi:predicted RNase H-like HicB family nuclease